MVEQLRLDILWVEDIHFHGKTEEWNGTNWSEGPDVNAGSAGRNQMPVGALQVKFI